MIEEGCRLFDRLIVAVGVNSDKKQTFSLQERLHMLKEATRNLPKVSVAHFADEYLVRYAKQQGATHIIRGIRNMYDFTYEQAMRHINQDLASEIATVFLMPPRVLGEVSSSSVKSMIGSKGWQKVVATMVPSPVVKILREKFKAR
jgi:pantetheine-phosphate adenylyltransferase